MAGSLDTELHSEEGIAAHFETLASLAPSLGGLGTGSNAAIPRAVRKARKAGLSRLP